MKKNILEKFSDIIWIFLIGSLAGFIYENLLMLFSGRYELRQGLLYEPLIPIYGIGLIVFYLIYNNIKLENINNYLKYILIFLIAFICGGITEYIGSFIQEKLFDTVSWNYSYMKFDLNGRTSLYHSTIWGIAGLIFYVLILPCINNFKTYKNNKIGFVFTIILSIVLILDCSISLLACDRRVERRNDIAAETKIDKFLDQYYPDSYIDRIYNNARVIKNK